MMKKINFTLMSSVFNSKFNQLIVTIGEVSFFPSINELNNFCENRDDVQVIFREDDPCTYVTLFEKRGKIWIGWDFWEHENALEIKSPLADHVFSEPKAPVCMNGAVLMNEYEFLGLCSSFYYGGSYTQEESRELCDQVESLFHLWDIIESTPHDNWVRGAQMSKIISSYGDEGWTYTTSSGRNLTWIAGFVYLEGFEKSETLRSSLLKSTDLLETPEWEVIQKTNRPTN